MQKNNYNQQAFIEQTFKKLQGYFAIKNWETVKADGCNIYTTKIEERMALKGDFVIEASLEVIAQFLGDVENLKKINEHLDTITILKKGENYVISRQKTKSIWPMDPRQIISLGFDKRVSDNKFYRITRSIDIDYPPEKGVIRAEMYISVFIVDKINQNKCKLTFIADTDPKGSIPDFLKNSMPAKRAQAMIKLKNILQKKK